MSSCCIQPSFVKEQMQHKPFDERPISKQSTQHCSAGLFCDSSPSKNSRNSQVGVQQIYLLCGGRHVTIPPHQTINPCNIIQKSPSEAHPMGWQNSTDAAFQVAHWSKPNFQVFEILERQTSATVRWLRGGLRQQLHSKPQALGSNLCGFSTLPRTTAQNYSSQKRRQCVTGHMSSFGQLSFSQKITI